MIVVCVLAVHEGTRQIAIRIVMKIVLEVLKLMIVIFVVEIISTMK